MDWLERHFGVFPAPELVLVLGAGQGKDLPSLLRSGARRVFLVEPQPRWADALRRQATDFPGVEVLECAVAEHDGKASLKVFNFSELSSLNPHPKLELLLPGARLTAELSVATRSLASLGAQTGASAGADNWLIVDTPGLEALLLEAFEDAELRRCFGHVVLRTSRPANRSERQAQEEREATLVEQGFRKLGLEDITDGDWPRCHWQFFNRSGKRRELEAAHRDLSGKVATLVAEKHELSTRLERQRVQYEDRMSKLDQQLQTATRDADQRLAALSQDIEASKRALDENTRRYAGEIDNLNATLEKQSSEYASAIATQGEQCAQLKADLERAHADRELKEQEILGLTDEVAQRSRRVAEVESQLHGFQARVEELEQTLETQVQALSRTAEEDRERRARAEAALEETRADLSVALRAQALRDADLQELQQRYMELTELNDRRQELLMKLGQRLGSASEYLKLLHARDGEANEADAATGLFEVLAGEPESAR